MFLLIIGFLSGCQQATDVDSSAALEGHDLLEGRTIIDLTHTVSPNAPFWAGDTSPFSYTAIATHESGMVVMGRYAVPEHFGTHLDAPIHGGDSLATVDQLSAEDLFGPAVVIDISSQAAADADYRLTPGDLLAFEAEHGPIPDGAIVLLNTGWSQKWDDIGAYRNADENGRMHFPGFSVESAQFLINERSIRGIGIDNMSVDYGLSQSFEAHGIVNGSGKYHLENVANVHLLPPTGAYLIVAPIKLEGGSGGQVRIWAVLP